MRTFLASVALLAALLALGSGLRADTLPFDLSISGNDIEVTKSLELSDLGEGKTRVNFDFADAQGKGYTFDLKYKPLPDNRSYPGNLDITLKDADGNKLGYLFFAINDVAFLKQMGTFGLILDVTGKPVDVRFGFDGDKSGELKVADLAEERLVQDTLVPKFGFQMIRPVLAPRTAPGVRSVSFDLDEHPYAVEYRLEDHDNGMVEFQYNLYRKDGDTRHLLERIYFEADSLSTLREAMFAGKYFDPADGTFKLVFYPTLGQTSPADAQN